MSDIMKQIELYYIAIIQYKIKRKKKKNRTRKVMSSGQYKRHDGFNPIQIKNGLVVRIGKNGVVRQVLGKQGEYGKQEGLKTR